MFYRKFVYSVNAIRDTFMHAIFEGECVMLRCIGSFKYCVQISVYQPMSLNFLMLVCKVRSLNIHTEALTETECTLLASLYFSNFYWNAGFFSI